MKTTLLYTISAFFLLGTSYAHEVVGKQVISNHKSIVEYRVVQLDEKSGALCSTNYTTATINDVKGATSKSVDCDE